MAEIPYEDLAGALRIRTEGPLLSVAAAPEVELTEPEPVAVYSRPPDGRPDL